MLRQCGMHFPDDAHSGSKFTACAPHLSFHQHQRLSLIRNRAHVLSFGSLPFALLFASGMLRFEISALPSAHLVFLFFFWIFFNCLLHAFEKRSRHCYQANGNHLLCTHEDRIIYFVFATFTACISAMDYQYAYNRPIHQPFVSCRTYLGCTDQNYDLLAHRNAMRIRAIEAHDHQHCNIDHPNHPSVALPVKLNMPSAFVSGVLLRYASSALQPSYKPVVGGGRRFFHSLDCRCQHLSRLKLTFQLVSKCEYFMLFHTQSTFQQVKFGNFIDVGFSHDSSFRRSQCLCNVLHEVFLCAACLLLESFDDFEKLFFYLVDFHSRFCHTVRDGRELL